LGDSRPTRWKLRAAIRLVNQTLAELHVEQHPDKTFIGRISRGFDFLGYAFTPAGLEVAPQTVERCVKRVSRLYEQGVDPIHIGAYVRRWHRWAKSGLPDSGEGLAWQVLRLTLRAVVALLLRFVTWLALSLSFACQTIGDAADACHSRYRKNGKAEIPHDRTSPISDTVTNQWGGVGSRTRWGQGMRNGSGTHSIQVARTALDAPPQSSAVTCSNESSPAAPAGGREGTVPNERGVFAFA